MAEAPQTFSESWYRVANQRISLRPAVRVRRQNFRGERWIVLENPFSNQFFRLRPGAYEFVARLRPNRTVDEVWQDCLQRFPDDAPGQEAVIQLLSQLYHASLLHYNLASDATQLFQRYEKSRQRENRSRLLNIMFMRFPLLDPDRFLIRTMPVVGKLISPIGGVIWVVMVLMGLKIVVDQFPELSRQTQGILAPGNLPLLYLGMVLVKTLHEFGHAYFCRRFGGEVHVMGVMLMIFTPIPYMDATSSWGFRSRWKRALVGAAGMIVEVFVAAIAALVWANTSPGTVHSLAHNMMLVASVSTVAFNMIPLMRFDGYYILSDLLDIPNLHQRARQQLTHWCQRYLFGVKTSRSPTESRREMGWLTVFGVASGIYRVFVFSAILMLVADQFLLLGLLMAGVCLVSWVVTPVWKLGVYLGTSPVLARNRARAAGVTIGGIGVLLLLLGLVPFPNHFRAPGVLESREWTQVLNESPGYVESMPAEPGTRVTRGQALVKLTNRELDFDMAAARANFEEVQSRLRQAMTEESANLKPLNSLLDSARKRIDRLQADQEALIIRARQDGTWVAPQVQQFVGRWLVRGSDLGLLVDPSSFRFKATVAQEDGDGLFAGRIPSAEVRLAGQAGAVLSVGELQIIPAEKRQLPSAALGWAAGGEVATVPNDTQGLQTIEPFFEVRADVKPNAAAAMLHGRAGKIRFELAPEPLLRSWARRFRQLIQKRYQV